MAPSYEWSHQFPDQVYPLLQFVLFILLLMGFTIETQVYTLKSQTHLEGEFIRRQILMSHCIGLFSMYYRIGHYLPLYLTIISSMVKNLLRLNFFSRIDLLPL